MFGIRTPPSARTRGTTHTPRKNKTIPRSPESLGGSQSPRNLGSSPGHQCSENKENLPEQEIWRTQRLNNIEKKVYNAINSSRNLKKQYKETLIWAAKAYRNLYIELRKDFIDSENYHIEMKEVREKLHENNRVLHENAQQIKELQEQIKNQQQEVTVAHKTYASVAAAGSPPGRPAATHSLVVSSTDEEMTGEEVLTRIRETIEAKTGWIKIEKVRKAKDRKVVMAFNSIE